MAIKFCNKPDRHVPKIKCGYPLPCPWHTVVIENNVVSIPSDIHSDTTTIKHLQDIANILNKNDEE